MSYYEAPPEIFEDPDAMRSWCAGSVDAGRLAAEKRSPKKKSKGAERKMNEPLVAELDHEIQGTRKMLERVPADKFDFKPHAKSGSLIWLANHVATVFDWGYQTLSTPSLVIDDFTPPPLPKTSEELMQAFDKSSGQFRENSLPRRTRILQLCGR